MKDMATVKTVLKQHGAVLRDKYKVKAMGIFGSFVRGEQREESDLDLLVEFEETISLLDLAGLEIYLTELLGIKVDVIPKEDVRPELKDEIFAETSYV